MVARVGPGLIAASNQRPERQVSPKSTVSTRTPSSRLLLFVPAYNAHILRDAVPAARTGQRHPTGRTVAISSPLTSRPSSWASCSVMVSFAPPCSLSSLQEAHGHPISCLSLRESACHKGWCIRMRSTHCLGLLSRTKRRPRVLRRSPSSRRDIVPSTRV
ncbi:hypothetical protein GY45DRAFT_957595 [Cubamyces sp. BRFM 1775]|nr:hypothetical protein GY45DRAFT_957595 [Cubamyces sp. BRFM 1775]